MRELTRFFLLFIICSTSFGFAQVTYTWNGGDTLWNTPSAWTPIGIPGSLDTAIINSGKVTLNTNRGVASFQVNGGIFYANAHLIVTSSMVWSEGNLESGGTQSLEIASGATLTINGAVDKNLNTITLINNGSALWSGTGNLNFQNNASFENASGATFNIENDAFMNPGASGGNFVNAGTLTKNAGAGASVINITLNSSGAVTVNSGKLTINRTATATNAVFNASANSILEFSTSTHTLDNVTFSGSGSIELNEDTLIVEGAGATFNNGVSLTMLKGEWHLNAPVIMNGTFNWERGTIIGSSTFTMNGVLTMSGYRTKTIDGITFINNDSTIWEGSGNFKFRHGAVFENTATGTFAIQGDALMNFATDGGTFNNAGTVTKNAGPDTTLVEVPFNNTGTLTVNNGFFRLINTSDFSTGNINIDSDGRLEFAEETHNIGVTVSISGAGILALTGGTLNLDGVNNFSSVLLVSAGTLNSLNNSTLNGPLNWSGGIITGNGSITAANSLNISEDAIKTLESTTLFNQGTATWTGSGTIALNNNAILENQPGGIFDIQTDATMSGANPGSFNNSGTVTKSAGAGTATLSLPFENDGILEVTSGILKFTDVLNNNTSGVIRGTQTLDVTTANFAQNGTVNPGASPGVLTIDGNYPQSAAGTLNIEVGGTTAGSGYDRLIVSNTAGLDGTLNVSILNNFQPTIGDTFEVMTYNSRSGAFVNVNVPIVNGSPLFDYTYTTNRLLLIAAGEDTTITGTGAVNDTVDTPEDTPVNINVLANDNDPNGLNITLISFSTPINGSTSLVSDSTINYSPLPNFFGEDSFTYEISNEIGERDTATVYVNVLAVNDPPAITTPLPDVNFPEDNSHTLDLKPFATDIDNSALELTWTATVLNAQGTAAAAGKSKWGGIPIEVDTTDLQISVNPATNIAMFTNTADSNGVFTVEFVVNDPAGASDRDTIIVTVTPVNDAPQLSVPDIFFMEDSTYTLNLDQYVHDPESTPGELTWAADVVNAQGIGSRQIGSNGGSGVIEVDTTDLQITIDPATRVATFIATGDTSGIFTVIFSASDPEGATGTDTMLVTVLSVNDPPLLLNPITDVEYPEDSGEQIVVTDLSARFADPDPNTVFTFSISSDNPDIQAVLQEDTITVNATENYFGSGNVAVTADDGTGITVSDTFMVTITPVNDPPVISGLPDSLMFDADTSVTLNIWDYVEDIETSDTLLTYDFFATSDSLLHSFDNTTGALTLSAVPGFSGEVFFNVEVTDDSNAVAADTIHITVNPVVGIDPLAGDVPLEFVLKQNYPNPFNPGTTIDFQIAKASEVKLTVYNLLGQKVRTLVNERLEAGRYQAVWDGRNERGFPLASGVYVYRLEAGDFRQMKKMILLK
jgi:flagellar hook assembly protein FlgD